MARIILTVSISVLLFGIANGQKDSNSVFNINCYIRHIDSLIDRDEKQNFIVNSIAEGTITQENVTTSIAGHSGKKVDTTKKIIKGGFGKYTAQNINGDTVYKIKYHDNLQKNFYLIFYFKDNILIYSKLDYQENGIGQTFYKKEEYYKDGEIISTTETKNEIEDIYKSRTDINLYKKGLEYYDEFLKSK